MLDGVSLVVVSFADGVEVLLCGFPITNVVLSFLLTKVQSRLQASFHLYLVSV
jgi:hypothetical protein